MIKIQCTHINKSYNFCQALYKLSKAPFLGNSPYIIAFFDPSPKNWWIPIILTFFIFNLAYLLKLTKFLVKICQFKYLVMADKHFGLYFFLLFKILDFSLSIMQQLQFLPPPTQKSHPLFSSNLSLKIEILSGPLW